MHIRAPLALRHRRPGASVALHPQEVVCEQDGVLLPVPRAHLDELIARRPHVCSRNPTHTQRRYYRQVKNACSLATTPTKKRGGGGGRSLCLRVKVHQRRELQYQACSFLMHPPPTSKPKLPHSSTSLALQATHQLYSTTHPLHSRHPISHPKSLHCTPSNGCRATTRLPWLPHGCHCHPLYETTHPHHTTQPQPHHNVT
jgi:hypothetical protein